MQTGLVIMPLSALAGHLKRPFQLSSGLRSHIQPMNDANKLMHPAINFLKAP